MESQNLKSIVNKKILVTKSKEESKNSLRILSDAGAEIIFFPTIKIEPSYKNLDLSELISNPHKYDYIIFTSANAVQVFSEMLSEYKYDLSKTKIAVVGKATAEECRSHGIYLHIIPEEFSARGLIKKFSEIGIDGKNILIPGSSLSREDLKLGLTELGANVLTLPIYDVVINEQIRNEHEYQFVINNKPDIFIFTSPSSFENYIKLLNIENVSEYFQNKIVCAIGPTTEFEIRSYGINVNVVPSVYTLEGVSEALIEFLKASENLA